MLQGSNHLKTCTILLSVDVASPSIWIQMSLGPHWITCEMHLCVSQSVEIHQPKQLSGNPALEKRLCVEVACWFLLLSVCSPVASANWGDTLLLAVSESLLMSFIHSVCVCVSGYCMRSDGGHGD